MDWKNEPAANRIIVALDCAPDEAIALGEQLAGHARWVKVGMTLYYAVGPSIVRQFHKLGFKVFLDLKLHDIPHQVYGAAASVATAGADLMTVHAAGGTDMMSSAVKGARKGAADVDLDAERPTVCAITVLTSMDAAQLAAIGVQDEPAAEVERLAVLAKESGLDGIVCSPQDACAFGRGRGHRHPGRTSQGCRPRRPEPRVHAQRGLRGRGIAPRHRPPHHEGDRPRRGVRRNCR